MRTRSERQGGGPRTPAAPLPAIAFDIGGTILSLDHPRIERAVRAAGGQPAADWVERSEVAARRAVDAAVRGGGGSLAVWNAFLEAFLEAAGTPRGEKAAVRRELEAFHRRQHLWNRLVPGAREMLVTASRAGHRVAAISNSDGRAEWILAQLGLGAEFEFVLDSAEVGIEKPDPRIFRLAAGRFARPAEDCLYVGDVLTIDAEGARAAGFSAVLLDSYGAYRAEELPPEVRRIVEPSQLAALLADPAADRREPEEAR